MVDRAQAIRQGVSAEERQEHVLRYLPLVRGIANGIRQRLPESVDVDDLVQTGVMGLFQALENYQPDSGVPFELYAKHRVRGAVLDGLRRLDWVSRDQRKRYKAIDAATEEQAQKLGRVPTHEEVAKSLSMSEEDLEVHRGDLNRLGLNLRQQHRVEDFTPPVQLEQIRSRDQSPDELAASSELQATLTSAVDQLPTRYQEVIRMYYEQERTMREIGNRLGVNESRVSQIHKAALKKLGGLLAEKERPTQVRAAAAGTYPSQQA